MTEIVKNQKKTINSWALFDWANSAYALVISTAVFPPYFTKFTPDVIDVAGVSFSNSSLYSFAVSISYLIIACLSPLLSGIADSGGRRMYFLRLFTILGAVSCTALFFFEGEAQLWLGTIAFMVATIGFAGGIVFYNSFLPLIVTEDKYDSVSAKGFAYGYIGSVILLIFILVMISKPAWFGISDPQLPARIGFVLVGLWWLVFGFISFRGLPKDVRLKSEKEGLISKGYKEIKSVAKKLNQQPVIKKFLTAFFFYSAGVQTIIYLATVFAEKELGFQTADMILLVLILQLVAIVGAYIFAWVSKAYGNKQSLISMVIIWIAICIAAYFTTGMTFFYVLAGFVGMVMGGIQSQSRSTYSKLIEGNEADVTSYFSFYDVLYKISIVAGTVVFGVVDNLTKNMRYSVLALSVFFLIGLIVLLTTDLNRPNQVAPAID